MATRNKPKKADFVHNKKRYWFSECDVIDISDSEDTTAFFFESTVLDYETDQPVPDTLWEDNEFSDKVDRGQRRAFPNLERELSWEENY